LSRAVNDLWRELQIGVAHHEVDVFILEPVTDRCLSRLCDFAGCPKHGKRECLIPGCGQPAHLHQRLTVFRVTSAPVILTDRPVRQVLTRAVQAELQTGGRAGSGALRRAPGATGVPPAP
jgi:hypothetical protein